MGGKVEARLLQSGLRIRGCVAEKLKNVSGGGRRAAGGRRSSEDGVSDGDARGKRADGHSRRS